MKIDSELTRALLLPNESRQIGENAPVRKIVDSCTNLDWETEVDIGSDRTADIMITCNYKLNNSVAAVIEIENDREFDPEEVLRRVKRQRTYPNVVIIPKEFQRHSYQFQKAGIPVWFWTATCRWLCRNCGKITSSSSSYTPSKCQHCPKTGFLSMIEPENVQFEAAERNPRLVLKEIPRPQVSFGKRPSP